jgi:uncharacterized protein (DUF2344 family)
MRETVKRKDLSMEEETGIHPSTSLSSFFIEPLTQGINIMGKCVYVHTYVHVHVCGEEEG